MNRDHQAQHVTKEKSRTVTFSLDLLRARLCLCVYY